MANANGPVERKVTVAGFTAAVSSAILAILIKQWPTLSQLELYLEVIIVFLVTGAVTAGMAWWAKHTPRNDAGTRKTGTSDPIPPTDHL